MVKLKRKKLKVRKKRVRAKKEVTCKGKLKFFSKFTDKRYNVLLAMGQGQTRTKPLRRQVV